MMLKGGSCTGKGWISPDLTMNQTEEHLEQLSMPQASKDHRENAKRRDPMKYNYSCVPCLEFRKGTFRQGDASEYAHGVFECWLHPA
uniref:Uncharacterized protein n=1 Tax=Nelumbo nucifera TaxID=4432 RepID=A0A822YN74_NELNU|nr:TPA_asm: hypothetical protein HUJ06_006264 [Nelumbo nucifera]